MTQLYNREQREMEAGAQPIHSLSSIVSAPVHGVVLPTSKVVLPGTVNPIWKLPCRYAQEFVSYMTLDLAELTN